MLRLYTGRISHISRPFTMGQKLASGGSVSSLSHCEGSSKSALKNSQSASVSKQTVPSLDLIQKSTSSGGRPSSIGGVGVGGSSSSVMSKLIGIAIGTSTLTLPRSPVSSPNSLTLSWSRVWSWFGFTVALFVESWSVSSSALPSSKTSDTMLLARSSSSNDASSSPIAAGKHLLQTKHTWQ